MKAYVVRSEKKIEPFGEHPRECLIVNRPLSELQKSAITGVGALFAASGDDRAGDNDEYLLLEDSLYFTPELLQEFVIRSRRMNIPTVCALKTGVTTKISSIETQDVRICESYVEYGLHYFPALNRREGAQFQPVVIYPDEFMASLPIPAHMCGGEKYLIPMADKLIIQIDHWANLWVASILTILAEGARLMRKSRISKIWLALRARSFNKWKILRQLNKIGRDCDIHPTAYIEGSTVGDRVVVGAGAIIRESVVGDGATIGNGVVVEESVIGDGCTIMAGHVLYSVFYPSSFAFTGRISASLLGREVFLGSTVTLTDFRFDDKNVTVIKNGKVVDSGNRFLGSCLGHSVYLGSGCIVAPGRTIASRTRISAPKERVITNPV